MFRVRTGSASSPPAFLPSAFGSFLGGMTSPAKITQVLLAASRRCLSLVLEVACAQSVCKAVRCCKCLERMGTARRGRSPRPCAASVDPRARSWGLQCPLNHGYILLHACAVRSRLGNRGSANRTPRFEGAPPMRWCLFGESARRSAASLQHPGLDPVK